MKTLRYILYSAAAAVMMSCSEEVALPSASESINGGEGIVIGIEIPDLGNAKTRSWGETPTLDDMELVVLEFEWGETYASRFLHAIHQEATGDIETQSIDYANKTIYFRIKTLDETDERRVLHLIAHPRTHDQVINLGEITAASNIIPRLYAGNGYDMYSARVDFPKGYCEFKGRDENDKSVWEVRPETKSKLTNVPMLRNFAQVNVQLKADGDAAINNTFDLEGFCLINKPKYGTAEPWDETERIVPDFMVQDNAGGISYDGNKYRLKKYQELTDEGYTGFTPKSDENSFDNWHLGVTPGGDGGLTFDMNPEYTYERPFVDSSERTCVIVKGKRAGNTNSSYYKLDLGNTMGLFEPYNILRNFKYTINIDKVDDDGYDSAAEAATGTAFNNQIGSTEAQTLTSISDGIDFISASTVNHVFVDQTPLEITFRYLTGMTVNAADLLETSGLEVGDVIKSIETKSKTANSWVVKITPNPPSASLKSQSFNVYKENGLSRRINLWLRNPYQFQTMTTNGVDRLCEAYYWNWYNRTDAFGKYNLNPDEVSKESGTYLTIYFNLEDGIPESAFPLEFEIESYEQELENNKAEGSMVVTTGKSLFATDKTLASKPSVNWTDDDLKNYNALCTVDPSTTRIKYIRTVSYNEYTYIPADGDDKDFSDNWKNAYHTIRARFQTTTAGEGERHLRISCKSFIPLDDTYNRCLDYTAAPTLPSDL